MPADTPRVAEGPHLARRGFMRGFLGLGLAATAGAAILDPVPVLAGFPRPSRRLSFHNVNTGESYSGEYWSNGRYQPEALREINRFLRDWRTGDVHMIDPRLLDLLSRLQQRTAGNATFEIICGYRCPRTNAVRYAQHSGVAKNSFHMRGQAIDLRLPGISLDELHGEAVELRGGGVGYYPRSGFIHVDVGPVRYWGASRYHSRPFNRRHQDESPLDSGEGVDAESLFDGQDGLPELEPASYQVSEPPEIPRVTADDDAVRPVLRETPRHRRHSSQSAHNSHNRHDSHRGNSQSAGHHGKASASSHASHHSGPDKHQRRVVEALVRRGRKPSVPDHGRVRVQLRLPHRKPHGVG